MASARHNTLEQQEWTAESGQAAVSVVLMLGLFLLGTVGFGVDLTNVWFHRQNALAATDAACEAGAMDLVYAAAGEPLSTAHFTAGTASNCVTSPSATMCTYAAKNGYNGTGLVSNTASNSVAWTFPSTVSGVTAGGGTNSFLTVTISENVPTYFMRMISTSKVLNISTSATCGVAGVRGSAPVLVLAPTASGAFTYSGGSASGLYIYGGPNRGVQINSNSTTAVSWSPSMSLNTSQGGPNNTGSDVGIVGGPAATSSGAAPSSVSFTGGTTGNWRSGVPPIPDPFVNLSVPTSVKSSPAPAGAWVAYGTDGCPDHVNRSGQTNGNCYEYSPGYYASGLNVINDYSTIIFKPGIYYLNGSLLASGSNTFRIAKPSGYVANSSGVMFYFLTGSLQISGGSGGSNQCTTLSGCTNIDPVAATDLTCDGKSPNSSLGMGTYVWGNVLYGQCTTNGTYWDSGNDTTDTMTTPTSPGVRGILVFQDHSDTTAPSLTGSGSLTFSGTLYMHCTSTTNGVILSVSGGSSTTSYMIGEIVVDQINLSGSGVIKLALNSSSSILLGKVGEFQ